MWMGGRWVKKMGKLHFGYKRHTVTDENGLVLAEETTAANESDIKHLETPMEKANLPQGTPVYADKGYDSAENRRALGKMKLKSRIIHKGTRARKITERERSINVAISKVGKKRYTLKAKNDELQLQNLRSNFIGTLWMIT